MARNKQTGPEIKLYQIDTMIYLTAKNIVSKIEMFSKFLEWGGINKANNAGVNKARALERFDKNYKISDIEDLNTIDGQANETWLRKSGFLVSTDGKYELSPVATAIIENKVSIAEYCFLILSKQWVTIKNPGEASQYKTNLLALVLDILSNHGEIAIADFVTTVNQDIVDKYISDYKGLALSNQEASRFLIDPLLLSGILETGDGVYRISEKHKELIDNYLVNYSRIQNPSELSCIEEHYLNCFKYGVFDIIDEENQRLYLDLYPNLLKSRNANISVKEDRLHKQCIYYGCPGSGKSHEVRNKTNTFNDEGFAGLSSIERQQAYQKYLDDKHGHKKTYKGGGTNIYALTHPKLMGYISSCTEYEINSLFEISNEEDFNAIIEALKGYEAYQNDSITKGSGCHWETGLKSYGEFLKDQNHNTERRKDAVFRTTFHPDTDYAAFVGCYKPGMNDGVIEYSFTPQVFTNAYIAAWENTKKSVYLVIEEINRGNCAQIFGDLFQLLDRDKVTGKSEYPIKADKDLVAYIEKVLGAGHEGIKNGELCLPSNLIIYATMNTSDQSLFPMDSAFKRRWDWEYVPINYSKDIDSGKFIINIAGAEYLWVDFLEKVNDKIYDATNSEDKQMGNFFIKKSVDAKEFINKVMFYLWNEVCKEEYGTQRNFFRKGKDGKTEFKFTELFGADQTTILNEFMTSLGVEPTNKPNPEEPAAE